MRWMVDRAVAKHAADSAATININSEISPGSLYASGLIAAGGLVGLIGVIIKGFENFSEQHGGQWRLWRFSDHKLPFFQNDWLSVLMSALLAFSLYHFARKPLDPSAK